MIDHWPHRPAVIRLCRELRLSLRVFFPGRLGHRQHCLLLIRYKFGNLDLPKDPVHLDARYFRPIRRILIEFELSS